MTIDILLSTYNGARFVDAQIESLLFQSYKDIHLIIRDDGSKDETPQKLLHWKQLHPDLIELHLESNVGVIESFNKLAALSKGPYLAFCDQDDIWLPHKLESCMQLMDQTKPCLVHSDLKVVDSNLREIHPSFWDYSYLSGDAKYATFNRLLGQNVVTGCTTLLNRELAALAFPVPKEAIMHDWWLALAASCFGKVTASQEQLIHYRQHGNNTVGAKPFSLLSNPMVNFSRLLKLSKHERHKMQQAEAFLQRYHSTLNVEKIQLIHAFMDLREKIGFSRMKTIMKYKLYKIGWQRNLFHLLKLR